MDVNADLLEGGSGLNLGQDRLLSCYLVQSGPAQAVQPQPRMKESPVREEGNSKISFGKIENLATLIFQN